MKKRLALLGQDRVGKWGLSAGRLFAPCPCWLVKSGRPTPSNWLQREDALKGDLKANGLGGGGGHGAGHGPLFGGSAAEGGGVLVEIVREEMCALSKLVEAGVHS